MFTFMNVIQALDIHGGDIIKSRKAQVMAYSSLSQTNARPGLISIDILLTGTDGTRQNPELLEVP